MLEEEAVAADSKAKLLDDAERYVLHGKIRLAISEYLKIINLDPEDVLILNTIGDLYLRQNNWAEANKFFMRVADQYVRNNFFLKAIAVYKKVLHADPGNLEVNTTVASLYAKQGLSLDACNQYLRVIELLEKDGRSKETLEIYEKIAELDPLNSKIQKKLAELHFADGAGEKAQAYWVGAARAQVKAGDLDGAVSSYQSAMQLDPLDVAAMRGFLDCCLKIHQLHPALDQLRKSLELAPQNLDLREMLGQACLETGDCDTAAKAFQMVVSMDDARYENFFALAEKLLQKESLDQASGCLDPIIPTLITRRETERAVRHYQQILQKNPQHVLTLIKQASLYSAIGDLPLYLGTLDELADYYLAENRPIEALEYIEKILHADPENEKHRQLHHQAFTAGYPDVPYVPPALPPESADDSTSPLMERDYSISEEELPENIVEVDLLLNYGLKDKALSLLQNLEARDPRDKEVRVRLLSIYKTEGREAEAAEQCLYLAALNRLGQNDDAAQAYLSEAGQLAPEMVDADFDLADFARSRGIADEMPPEAFASDISPEGPSEVDLSADLMSSLLSENKAIGEPEYAAIPEIPDAFGEAYSPDITAATPPAKSLDEQFQEVDFYIRLGFNDEALSKLGEIARISPNNPELAARYEKLGEAKPESEVMESILFEDSEKASTDLAQEMLTLEADREPQEKDTKSDLDKFLENYTDDVSEDSGFELPPEPAAGPAADSQAQMNDMFADLMDEVRSPENEAADRAAFEEHFSLGTAYREMELVDDAVKEFETALKSIEMKKGDQRVIQCCGMLSTCFLKKNMPRSVLRWCQTGLNLTDPSSHEALAFRYDMGIAHAMAGSSQQALECFDQIFSLDPSYRDVAQRIDELKGGNQRHAP